jgi:hypothetical protein
MPDTGVASPSSTDGSPIALLAILALVAAVTTVGVRAARIRR